MRALGLEDPKGPALRLMASLSFPALYDPESPTLGLSDNAFSLIETFYDRGAEAIDFFAEIGATTFYSDEEVPDYFARHPENAAPYGRLLKPPERRIGHDGAAQAHLGRMIDFTTAHGGVVRTNHRVMGLLRNEAGEVVGAEVRAGLRTILVRAKRAIVFGTGGFLHDPELRQQFLLGPTLWRMRGVVIHRRLRAHRDGGRRAAGQHDTCLVVSGGAGSGRREQPDGGRLLHAVRRRHVPGEPLRASGHQ